jgi:hypothetical protein
MPFFFQLAILTYYTVDLSEKDRLFLAFSDEITEEELEGEDIDLIRKGVSEEALTFDKIAFLKGFANYGAEKLSKCVTNNDSETMESIMEFMNDSYNGKTPELKKMKEITDSEELIDYM